MSEFHTYLIGARREHDDANLDWVVTAETPDVPSSYGELTCIVPVVRRQDVAGTDDQERRATAGATPAGEVVWPWEQLLCDKGEYE